ncbi:radical SAM protein [Nonomuraea sp. NPDC049695]|uniref:radical SAM protein n=1 Tax=Nonomuraea sp. NPDC049695 TaxID=3154734 RepID=UPI00341E63CC
MTLLPPATPLLPLNHREITLLWALRSRCDLGCRYCYFGTIEADRLLPVTEIGKLSHLSRNDLPTDQILAFASTLRGTAVRRVFLAGGEPLNWRPITDLIAVLKDAGLEVVVCTNGIPLNRPTIRQALIDLRVDAVSVSLDSADPVYNDTWRPALNRRDGWHSVVDGVRALLTARSDPALPRVGLYSVITRLNLPDITAVPALAAELGCDYAVPQPISLASDHTLHDELALTPGHAAELAERFAALYAADLPLQLPERSYPDQVGAAVRAPTSVVRGCFGGRTLFFIEPDGTLWDCPSSLKIAATPAARRRSIASADGAALFAPPTGCASDCALFSADCVNMWPLMNFTHDTPTPAVVPAPAALP